MLADHEQDRLVELLVVTAEVIGDQLRPTTAAYMVRPVSQRQYLSLVELGFQRVRGRLEGVALAA